MPLLSIPDTRQLKRETTMATILRFELRHHDAPEQGSDCGKERGAARGEVVIFPGVRLERHAFSLSDRLPDPDPGKPGTKRRRQTPGT
jgi:hypothetical protein